MAKNIFSENTVVRLVMREPSLVYDLTNPSEQVVLVAVKKRPDYLATLARHLTPEGLKIAVRNHPDAIKYIKDPSHELKLEAIRGHGEAIFNITDATEAHHLAAIESAPRLFAKIQNPSLKVQEAFLKGLKNDWWGIRAAYKKPGLCEKLQMEILKWSRSLGPIPDPTDKVVEAAMKVCGRNILHVKNPSPKLRKMALRNWGEAIKHISDPTEEEKIIACRQNGSAIRHIKDPSKAVQMAAIVQDGGVIGLLGHHDGIDRDVFMAAMKRSPQRLEFYHGELSKAEIEELVAHDGISIRHFPEADDDIRILAVKENPFAVRYIADPSAEVVEAARETAESMGRLRDWNYMAVQISLQASAPTYG